MESGRLHLVQRQPRFLARMNIIMWALTTEPVRATLLLIGEKSREIAPSVPHTICTIPTSESNRSMDIPCLPSYHPSAGRVLRFLWTLHFPLEWSSIRKMELSAEYPLGKWGVRRWMFRFKTRWGNVQVALKSALLKGREGHRHKSRFVPPSGRYVVLQYLSFASSFWFW